VDGSPYRRDPTPVFFSTSSLAYEFDPAAAEPANWLTFLGSKPVDDGSEVSLQIWPDDPQSVSTLQEWFGLHLVSEAKHQKMLALIGPTRSGKGTITSVLSALIGVSNVEGPTLASLEDKFGMEPLIGKRAAVIDDARISGKTDTAVIAERLLSISGQGLLTVPRKHISAWKGKLDTKVTILSNELPRLVDSSGAFAGRFLVLSMTRSFAGVEDPDLEAKLLPELPGILLWALDGWVRLRARGRFVQPESGKALLDELKNLSSPVRAFLEDCCEVGVGKRVRCDTLFAAWLDWCKQHGKREPGESSMFGRNLRSVIPHLKTTQTHERGERVRNYEGLEVRSGYYDDAGNLVPF
jgi:putative DNA primase/helicase